MADTPCESLTSPDERWAAVPGHEGVYEVSDRGRVRSIGAVSNWSRWKHYDGSLLKEATKTNGYKQVSLQVGGKPKAYLVHRLVLRAFAGDPPHKTLQACHQNGDKSDNRLCNLRWDTARANQRDRIAHGTSMHGHRHPRCLILESDEKDIAASKDYISEIARRYGIARQTVRAIKERYRERPAVKQEG